MDKYDSPAEIHANFLSDSDEEVPINPPHSSFWNSLFINTIPSATSLSSFIWKAKEKEVLDPNIDIEANRFHSQYGYDQYGFQGLGSTAGNIVAVEGAGGGSYRGSRLMQSITGNTTGPTSHLGSDEADNSHSDDSVHVGPFAAVPGSIAGEGKNEEERKETNELLPLSHLLSPSHAHIDSIEVEPSQRGNNSNISASDEEERSGTSDSTIAITARIRNQRGAIGTSNFQDLQVVEYESQDEVDGEGGRNNDDDDECVGDGDDESEGQCNAIPEEGLDTEEYHYSFGNATPTTAVAVVYHGNPHHVGTGGIGHLQRGGFQSNDDEEMEHILQPNHDEVRTAQV